MKRLITIIFPLFCVVALFAACDDTKKSQSKGPVIAEVDGNAITAEDFIKEVERIPQWAQEQFQNDEGKKKFLDELVKRELIYQYARKMKLDNDEEYISKVDEFKKMTLVSMVLKKEVEEKALLGENDARQFFDSNEDKFTIGSKIRASHILVGTEKEAQDILDRLNKGESFKALAKLSKDTGSAEKGGDLGFFSRGQMVPEFEQAALSLKPGELSKPVRTRFGYHIIKLAEIQKGDPASFEQSKESIQKQLLGEKRKKAFDSFVDKLKAEMKITTNDNELAAVKLPWEGAGKTAAPKQPADQ